MNRTLESIRKALHAEDNKGRERLNNAETIVYYIYNHKHRASIPQWTDALYMSVYGYIGVGQKERPQAHLDAMANGDTDSHFHQSAITQLANLKIMILKTFARRKPALLYGQSWRPLVHIGWNVDREGRDHNESFSPELRAFGLQLKDQPVASAEYHLERGDHESAIMCLKHGVRQLDRESIVMLSGIYSETQPKTVFEIMQLERAISVMRDVLENRDTIEEDILDEQRATAKVNASINLYTANTWVYPQETLQ